MSSEKQQPGTVGWRDLTVADAESVRDFYAGVVGWQWSAVDMGGYSDFNMLPADSDVPVAGICHARGTNASIPAQWMMYIIVADLSASMKRCTELGGEIIVPERHGFCIIRDPAGAVCALYQGK
jgi:predicted enzyme related to lactoylglutathione lyase